jgi:FrmR/RcnR family transcriptional regulator, repressor of rcnA expression
MAEVLEDHIRLHLLQDGHAPLPPELGEDLIDLVRAYLKWAAGRAGALSI